MNKATYFAALVLFCISIRIAAQTGRLRQNIEQVISGRQADIGVSICGIEDKDTLTIHNDRHYPMQSVFKFHIALTILNQVDMGKLKLTQGIHIKKEELLPHTHSPIRDAYPNGNITLSLADIIKYTVGQSDNNGCDILLRLSGGPGAVNQYIHKIGVKAISIQASEEEMHKAWDVQFSNWTTPKSATDLLTLFYTKNILSKNSFRFLWKIMVEATSGKGRIRGQLPEGTIVADKTGSSDTNDQGITAAINDIGIVTLPNGRHFAIAVFVSHSKENNETNEKVIADIAKSAWDYFVKKP